MNTHPFSSSITAPLPEDYSFQIYLSRVVKKPRKITQKPTWRGKLANVTEQKTVRCVRSLVQGQTQHINTYDLLESWK